MWIEAGKVLINFAPETIEEEVVQNVRMVLNTVQYSVPYACMFAQSGDNLDMPLDVVKALASSNVVRAIKDYEPRALVRQIEFKGDGLTGLIKPIVRISINE